MNTHHLLRRGFIRTFEAVIAASVLIAIVSISVYYLTVTSTTQKRVGVSYSVKTCVLNYVTLLEGIGQLQSLVNEGRYSELYALLDESGCSEVVGLQIYNFTFTGKFQELYSNIPRSEELDMITLFVPHEGGDYGYLVEVYFGGKP